MELSDLPKTFIVLSVHRSGSSFVMRALADAGVIVKHSDNSHWEDPRFGELNKEILAAAGGKWLDPPPENDVLVAAREREADIINLLDTLQNEGDLVGWKDPRQALTIDGFLPHLDGDVYLVALFRKPHKVAKSLSRSNRLTFDRALELVREYNRRLLSSIARFVLLDIT